MKVSVCMACYNGSKHIKMQMLSILKQLGSNDEIILVDDCSNDETIEIVKSLNDPRINMHRNATNKGVKKTFEKAISLACGEIIFLSDQDDIWEPNKVSMFIDIFKSSPNISLVLSDATVVDKSNIVLVESFFERRGGFVSGVAANIIKNKYLGCVMAMRHNLVNNILPFPSRIPQHDMWIGLIYSVYGDVYFINKPLVRYRSHDTNASSASSNKHYGVKQMVVWRLNLLFSLILRLCKITLRHIWSRPVM